MPATDHKSLFLRGMPTKLVREAKAAAARRGETLTTIVAEALTRSLAVEGAIHDRSDDLRHEMDWFEKHRAQLLRQYRDEYIAIVDRAVVDHGCDFDPLAERVFARFGNRNVYMPRVQDTAPEARVRSPRRLPP